MANSGRSGARSSFAKKKIITSSSTSTKSGCAQYLDKRADAVIPDFRQTELRNAVGKISGDLCISRPKSRLDWGIELPFDRDFVTYVWFDALTNYISFAGYDPNASAVATGLRPVETDASSKSLGTAHRAVATSEFDAQPQEFRDRWSKDTLQIIGKDILVPAHGIYWLIMLHAIGFPDDQMPQLLVHGWWNLGGAKMSKSVGNIVDPFVLADKYGADALRYYLMSDIATGQDADFSEERLIERYNADLANSLGNLLNRSLNMMHRYSPDFTRREINKDLDRALNMTWRYVDGRLHRPIGERLDNPDLHPRLPLGPYINLNVRLYRAAIERHPFGYRYPGRRRVFPT